jgi:hypothetical protein
MLILSITDSANADQQVLTPPSSSKLWMGFYFWRGYPFTALFFCLKFVVLPVIASVAWQSHDNALFFGDCRGHFYSLAMTAGSKVSEC